MKGLLKYLSPFAPDQSGAVSVLYELGGITVICDAGGCTGNICGFDEPRWFQKKSAIFSAGLRDMDAILGRDDRLVEKLCDTAQKVEAKFAALIGTPVPAVIGTDLSALKRMAQKRIGMPVLSVECTGTKLYDEGAQAAYIELFQTFAREKAAVRTGTIGVLGVTPLDTTDLQAGEKIRRALREKGASEVFCYGMGAGRDEIMQAGSVEKNLVISPSGLAAAKMLRERFGTPYETDYPLLDQKVKDKLHKLEGKKVLVIHQQVAANAVRQEILKAAETNVTVGTWFMKCGELSSAGDRHFDTEEEFVRYVEENAFDVIIGDAMFLQALRNYKNEFIVLPHFAVSGECCR